MRPDWLTLQRGLLGFAWFATIAGAIACCMFGVPRLQALAGERHTVPTELVTVRFSNPPAWINGPLGDSLMRTATMHVQGNPMVRNDLVAIRESLMSTGWFEDVVQVRRTEVDLVEINARFVQPSTLIRDADGYHLIDHIGRLLPKSYALDADLPVMLDARTGLTVPMIAITGVHFPRPAVGDVWEGGDVSAGLKLLAQVQHQHWRHQITAVDVSSVLKDGPIRLRTDTGSAIVWGGPPGEEAALELLAEGKLERLNLLYQNHGRIDGGRSGELDITGEKVAVAR